MSESQPNTWGYVVHDEIMYLLPTPIIDELVRLHTVFDCSTWGDVAELDADLASEVLGMAGYGTYEQYRAHLDIVGAAPLFGVEEVMAESYDPDAELPDPDDEFCANDLPAVADGDWPPSPAFLMTDLVPDELVEQFGRTYETVFNGEFTELEAEHSEEILAACAAMGMTVVLDERLSGLFYRM